MSNISAQPSLNQLYSFINKVDSYPLSIRKLLKIASETKAPKEVQSFYRAFPEDQVFKDEDELAGRTEQVNILREEAPQMPKEEERSPEEY